MNVTTCFLTNSVSYSLNHFWMVINYVCFKLAHETWIFCQLIIHFGIEIPYHLAFWLVKFVQSSGCISAVDLGTPDPKVRHTSSMTFTHMIRAVFSLIFRMCVTQYVASGRSKSKLLAASRHCDILLVCEIPCYATECIISSEFYSDFRSPLFGDFLHWVGCRVI